MKKLILIIILFLSFASCENPVNNSFKDNSGNPGSEIKFSIYQDYGYCDSTGCFGISNILLIDSTRTNVSYSREFTTGDKRYWNGTQWLESSGFTLLYQSETLFNITINNVTYTLTGTGTQILDLPFNTNILITIN